jgi:hypothetical protein
LSRALPPAPAPCGSCPYRRDVPSGLWEASEYERLPAYDAETWAQPHGVFCCHRQDGRLCAGWVAVHPMEHSFALRLAALQGWFSEDELDAILDYRTEVPLFASGAEACAHGLAEVEAPDVQARRLAGKLRARMSAAEAARLES